MDHFTAAADVRKRRGLRDQRLLPNWDFLCAALAGAGLPVRFDERGCIFFCFFFWLGVRDVVTFPPDAPHLQPSVTWEILADEIVAIHPLTFRGAFNVCIYETLYSDESLHYSYFFKIWHLKKMKP